MALGAATALSPTARAALGGDHDAPIVDGPRFAQETGAAVDHIAVQAGLARLELRTAAG